MTRAKDAEIVDYAILASLSAGGGGTVLLNQDVLQDAAISKDYLRSIRALEKYPFWTAGAQGAYRPGTGLWAAQRKAVAFALAYLACQRRQAPVAETLRESALVKMPTGTGKTGVIATLACCALSVRRTIILTPRKALVEQMILDLAWRFWKRFDFCYLDSELKPRKEVKEGRLRALERQREHSVEILRNEGYERIWASRSADRQVIVGTFNALHTVLGLKPPAHRSMEGRSAPKPSAALDECSLETGDGKGTENFRKLLRETDLLIVDEGHYEPAYSWAQCVNAINSSTPRAMRRMQRCMGSSLRRSRYSRSTKIPGTEICIWSHIARSIQRRHTACGSPAVQAFPRGTHTCRARSTSRTRSLSQRTSGSALSAVTSTATRTAPTRITTVTCLKSSSTRTGVAP